MKKLLVVFLLVSLFSLQFCTSSRRAKAVAKTTYASNVQQIITANCSPCHIPPNNRKKPYDNYVAVKTDVEDILKRVQMNPEERGFMPMRHPKLPDSTINVLVKWKADGLLEN